MSKKYNLVLNSSNAVNIEGNIYTDNYGNEFIDLSNFNKYKIKTYDPGLKNTAICKSKITYINGDEGVLLYRGYSIEDLLNHYSYLDICYLILFGELPTKQQVENFTEGIYKEMFLNDYLEKSLLSFSKSTHPMAMLSSLFTIYAGNTDMLMDLKKDNYDKVIYSILGKAFIFFIAIFRYINNKEFIKPLNNLNLIENLFYCLFEENKLNNDNPDLTIKIKSLDVLLSIHGDHEQNASTNVVRSVASSEANPCSSLAAAVLSLWGNKHGGANFEVISMLEKIASNDNLENFLDDVKNKKAILYGFGHRVYKNFDPRSKIIKKLCLSLSKYIDSKQFEVAQELSYLALNDDYFKERNLYPNVDFYSGLTMQALNFPKNFFTLIFALGRTVGWLSHYLEMYKEGYNITRPYQIYEGQTLRTFNNNKK